MFEPVKRKEICGGAGIKKIRLRIDAVRAWYVVRGIVELARHAAHPSF